MCCYTPSPVLRPAHAGFMYVLYCLSFTLQHPVGAPTQSFFLILFQTLAQCWPDGAACTNRARSKTSTYGAEHLYLHTSPPPRRRQSCLGPMAPVPRLDLLGGREQRPALLGWVLTPLSHTAFDWDVEQGRLAFLGDQDSLEIGKGRN